MTAVLEPITDVNVGEVLASELHHGLAAIAAFACTDQTIPMLNAVRMEAEGDTLTLVATDRFVLGSITVPYTGPDFTFNMPLADLKLLLPTIKAMIGRVAVSLRVEGGRLTVTHLGGEVRIPGYDSDYPKWRGLIPGPDPDAELGVSAIAVNPAHMVKFAKVAKKNEPARLFFTTSLKPIRVEIGERFVGLIMPMRDAAKK